MERTERPKSPGLKWPKRKHGPPVPTWVASARATKAGYEPKTVNLNEFVDRPDMLIQRAERLTDEMNLWFRLKKMPARQYDGTFKFILELYQIDAKSRFNLPPPAGIKPGTRKTYGTYLRKLIRHIGHLVVDRSDGRDVIDWFAEWRVGANGEDQLPAARTALAVLEAAISFAIVCRLKGVGDFKAILNELEFPRPKSRKHAPVAAQIVAARAAAHAHGHPRRALAYAFQMDTTGRQFDWTGIWAPVSDPRISDIVDGKLKWFGPRWSDIDENMILTLKPSKTEDSTAVEISYDLSVCPMVMEEIDRIPESERVGPLIVNENTGLPYLYESFRNGWRADYAAAGIPEEIWNRDTRAGGITERRLAGASKDDRRRLAGHADEKQTEEYERGVVDLEAHRNVMKAVKAFRQKNSG